MEVVLQIDVAIPELSSRDLADEPRSAEDGLAWEGSARDVERWDDEVVIRRFHSLTESELRRLESRFGYFHLLREEQQLILGYVRKALGDDWEETDTYEIAELFPRSVNLKPRLVDGRFKSSYELPSGEPMISLWYVIVAPHLINGNARVCKTRACSGIYSPKNPSQVFCDMNCFKESRRKYMRDHMRRKRVQSDAGTS